MATLEQRELSKLESERLSNKLQEVKRYMQMVQDILPTEQQRVGSECQIIDSAINGLYHKYANQNEGSE